MTSSPSGIGFYVMGKILRMVIRKNITLVAWYKVLHFPVGKWVVSGIFHRRYIIYYRTTFLEIEHEIFRHIALASSEGPDEPVQMCSLTGSFAAEIHRIMK